jgi:hypothetical protein
MIGNDASAAVRDAAGSSSSRPIMGGRSAPPTTTWWSDAAPHTRLGDESPSGLCLAQALGLQRFGLLSAASTLLSAVSYGYPTIMSGSPAARRSPVGDVDGWSLAHHCIEGRPWMTPRAGRGCPEPTVIHSVGAWSPR